MIQIIDADQSWKLHYLELLKESRETGRPIAKIIDADENNRFSLRRLR